MPQAPSPNMGIIWPSDHGDGDVWDALMDTAIRVVIDGHNHAAGSGAKVSISQLAFDADISFVDAGGGKHAITDLKAIDFFPVDPSAVTALAGAFFLSSVDNNLYYRTTTGANVKFTDGATINVGAFTGGFGGDYTGVGALAIFDDASDAYWFQQQVGTLVRQYGKVRSSDLSLFEFKAVGVTPVPSFAVTLKSPAALAANYAITFPGIAPVTRGGVQTDATGQLSFVGPFSFPFSLANSGPVVNTFTDNAIVFDVNSGHVNCPCAMPVGTIVTQWTLYIRKTSTSGTITAQLWDLNMTTGAPTQIGVSQTNNANNPGFITLGQSGLAATLAAGHCMYLIFIPSGVNGDSLFGWTVNGP